MIKLSRKILLILMMSSVALAEVPQKTQKEVIGQIDPFLSEIYIPLDKLDEEVKLLNENNEELKYEVKGNSLKISYFNTAKPMKLTLKKGNEVFNIKEVYPNSEISEKAYRDKNFNIFEIKNSYLYNAHNTDEGEYTTIIPTDEVSISFMGSNQPYKAITENENILNGIINLTVYDYNGNQLETEEIKVYEASDNIDIPLKEIYHKKFKEPIKVKLKWKFELGAYKTNIYDKEYEVSFIKDINLLLKCKDIENIYYENVE